MEYHYKKRGAALKLNKRNMAVLAVILASLSFIVLAARFYPWSANAVDYNGVRLVFDANLMDARNVPAYPSADAVKSLISGQNVKRLTFVFQNTSDSYLTKLNAVEIAIKMSYALKNFDPGFFNSTKEVKSFGGLDSTADNPYIVLVPPSISDGTYVKVVGNTVFISGRDRNDFSLAAAKFILSSLGINI